MCKSQIIYFDHFSGGNNSIFKVHYYHKNHIILYSSKLDLLKPKFNFDHFSKIFKLCVIISSNRIRGEGVRLLKTFKMLSMTAVLGDQNISIPLIDGIIINQENSHRSWTLEMYVDNNNSDLFEDHKVSGDLMEVKVVISYPENEPASFEVIVYEVKKIGDYVSVLFKGTLKRARRKYAEQLLSELISHGLSGDALVAQFEEGMRQRPQLEKDSAKV